MYVCVWETERQDEGFVINILKRFVINIFSLIPTRQTRGTWRKTEKLTKKGRNTETERSSQRCREPEANTHMQSGKQMRERVRQLYRPGSSTSLEPSCMSNLGFQRTLLCLYTKALSISQDRLIYAAVTNILQITVVSCHRGFALSMCQPIYSTRKLFLIILTQGCSLYPDMLPR